MPPVPGADSVITELGGGRYIRIDQVGTSHSMERRAREDKSFSPYLNFSREAWARLRGDVPLTLTETDLESLRGLTVNLSMEEVEQVYLPLSRLLHLYVAATQALHQATDTFLGSRFDGVPYIIGIAG